MADKSTFFTKKDYWNYLEFLVKVDPSAMDCIKSIAEMPHVKTPLGRGRAWIRYALMEKCLDVYIKSLAENKAITRDWYEDYAVLRSDIDLKIFLDSLSGLSTINFNLCLKDIDFDGLPHELKAYTLVEMEEWDDSSREATSADEKRSSPETPKFGLGTDLDKMRQEIEQLKEVKEEIKIIRDNMQAVEAKNQEKEEDVNKLKKQLEEYKQLVDEKQQSLAHIEAQLKDTEEGWKNERKKLKEKQKQFEELEDSVRRRESEFLQALSAEKESKRELRDKQQKILQLEKELTKFTKTMEDDIRIKDENTKHYKLKIDEYEQEKNRWAEEKVMYEQRVEAFKEELQVLDSKWQARFNDIAAEKASLEESAKVQLEQIELLRSNLEHAKKEAEAAAEVERENLLSQVEERTSEFERLRGESNQIKEKLAHEELARLNEKAHYEASLRTTAKELELAKSHSEELCKRIQELEALNQKEQQDQQVQKAEFFNLKEEKMRLEQQLNEINNDMKRYKGKEHLHNEERQSLQANADKIQEELASLRKLNEALEVELEQERQQRKRERKQRKKVERDIELLQMENSKIDRELKRIEEKAEMKEREIIQLQNRLEGREDANIEEVSLIRTLQEKVDNLEHHIELSKQQNAESEQRCRELEREAESLRTKLHGRTHEIERNEQEVELAKNTISEMKKEKENLYAELQKLRSLTVEHESLICQLRSEGEMNQARLARHETEHEQMKQSLQVAKVAETTAADDANRLRHSISEIEKEKERIQQTLDSLLTQSEQEKQTLIAALEKRDQDVEATIAKLKEEHNEAQRLSMEQVKQLTCDAETLKTQIEDDSRKLKLQEEEMKVREIELTRKIQELEAEKEKLDQANREIQTRIAEFSEWEAERRKAAETLVAKEMEQIALHEEIQELREELDLKKQLLERRTEELEKAERKANHNQELRKELKNELKRALAERELKIKELEASLKMNENKDSKDVVERLSKQLDQVSAELASEKEKTAAFSQRDAENKKEIEEMKRHIEGILRAEQASDVYLNAERQAKEQLQLKYNQDIAALQSKIVLLKQKRMQDRQQTEMNKIADEEFTKEKEAKEALSARLKEKELELEELNKLAVETRREREKALEELVKLRDELSSKANEREQSLLLVERTLKECTDLVRTLELSKKKERELNEELQREREYKAKATEDLKRYQEIEVLAKSRILELEQNNTTQREQVDILKKLLALKTTEVDEIKEQNAELMRELERIRRELQARPEPEESIAPSGKWMPDDAVKQCPDCMAYFGITRRKHHCRNCGGIFCSSCSAQQAIIPAISSRPVRVCNDCFKLLLSS